MTQQTLKRIHTFIKRMENDTAKLKRIQTFIKRMENDTANTEKDTDFHQKNGE